MKIAAPGKLMLTGAYAVLDGAPAIVIAVDRLVVADTDRIATDPVRPEIAAVARRLEAPAPHVDSTALEADGKKLGLGSSAAGAVAAAGAILASRGVSLDAVGIAKTLQIALESHAAAQPRGSGADVVASARGGVIEVVRREGVASGTESRLPKATVWRAFACGRPTRTSDVLDRLDARRGRVDVGAAVAALVDAAGAGATACRRDDASALTRACAAHVAGLQRLGDALDLALVPAELAEWRSRALSPSPTRSADRALDDVVLLPSGAGGGDVVLWIGTREPTDHESRALREAGLTALQLSISLRGVHVVEASQSTRN